MTRDFPPLCLLCCTTANDIFLSTRLINWHLCSSSIHILKLSTLIPDFSVLVITFPFYADVLVITSPFKLCQNQLHNLICELLQGTRKEGSMTERAHCQAEQIFITYGSVDRNLMDEGCLRGRLD